MQASNTQQPGGASGSIVLGVQTQLGRRISWYCPIWMAIKSTHVHSLVVKRIRHPRACSGLSNELIPNLSGVLCDPLSAFSPPVRYKIHGPQWRKTWTVHRICLFRVKSENTRHTGRRKTMYANKRIGWGKHIAKPIKDPDLWSTYVVF